MTDLDKQIGARLRAVRESLGLACREVEDLTGGEFKTSALGAYERGERSITAAKLVRLARVYRIRPSLLLV